MSAEERLTRLGIHLPELAPSGGKFRAWQIAGPLLYLAGQGPRDAAGNRLSGLVPTEVDIAEARHRARLTGLMLLSATREALGSLDRVEAVVKLLGMVRATPEFGSHSEVIDGCSELFIQVFGEEIGGHARSAVGMGSLPHGISVEIEAILLIRSD